MQEWIPFLEAVHRMTSRLIMTDFTAKPLLRSAAAAGRVSSRGEYRERGEILFVVPGEKLDDGPNVIREGSLFYKAEVYPGEVVLAELRSWIESLDQDSPLQSLRHPQINTPVSVRSIGSVSAAAKPRGRRPQYDWETFRKVALEKFDEEGSFDPGVDARWNKAALERFMAAWCQQNWGTEPSESAIRSKLTEIEAVYLEGRKGL